MNTSIPELRATSIITTETHLVVRIEDGRVLMVPLSWYPKLFRATLAQRGGWRLIAGGLGICWDEIDEDLSVEGMLSVTAKPAPIPKNMSGWVDLKDKDVDESQTSIPRSEGAPAS